MSKKLVIIGASGHGKVIADIALKNGYEIVGFLDDNDAVKEIAGFPVLGSVSEIPSYQTECEFIIAIGNNRIREMIAEQYAVNWATLIHPTAVIGMDVQIDGRDGKRSHQSVCSYWKALYYQYRSRHRA